MKEVLYKINDEDNVSIALEDHKSFRRGFKYACKEIKKNEPILKYGIEIGKASKNIKLNEEVHIDNIIHTFQDCNFSVSQEKIKKIDDLDNNCELFKNPDGGFATQKNILLICSVSCVNGLASEIIHPFSGVSGPDDVRVLPVLNPSGCGHVSTGTDLASLRKLLQGYINNPNCFGAVILRLGCEDFQDTFKTNKPLLDISFQNNSSKDEVITKANQFIINLKNKVDKFKRESVLSSNLTIGLQCGGSDGLSAITCNPQLGYISDYHGKVGGKTILAETPEILGSREWLLSRCKKSDTQLLKNIFQNWDLDGKQLENPSPGNISGGISNIFEKSLGSVLKGGTSNLAGVLCFGDQVGKDSGLYFLDSPGYDPMSITGQIAAGANLICFTTGKGSSYQNSFSPVLKISSNTFISNKISGLIDYDAQEHMYCDKEIQIKKMYELILDFASGKSQNRVHFNTNDFIPWIREGSN